MWHPFCFCRRFSLYSLITFCLFTLSNEKFNANMECCIDLSHVHQKIEDARLVKSDLLPLVQPLYINNNEQEDLRLIELNTELTKELETGKILAIRGENEDSAVICSETSTFELREAETSNSLLTIQNLLWVDECNGPGERCEKREVNGIFHTFFELKAIKPKFNKLRHLLETNSYKGKAYEDDSVIDKYTFEDLLSIVQASALELKDKLGDLQTCVIDGFIRILDFDYKFSVVDNIMSVIDSRSIPINKIPKTVVLDNLEDLEPREIVEQCFSWFTNAIDSNDAENELYALNEDEVCRFYAIVLLKSVGRFHLGEFFESWQTSVPHGLNCTLSQLEGIALTDLTSQPEVIFYFVAHDLPEDISERFEKLFTVKRKWTYEEIYLYIKDRAYAGNDPKTLLIKYTRESTRGDGVKVYSSKW